MCQTLNTATGPPEAGTGNYDGKGAVHHARFVNNDTYKSERLPPRGAALLPVACCCLAGLLAPLTASAKNTLAEPPAPRSSQVSDGRDAQSIADLRRQLGAAERQHGAEAAELIPILSRLAAAELAAGEREYAAIRLERELELLRYHQGHYNQALMTPLLKLANIYMDTGRFSSAIDKLRYAQHLTQRRDGVYSLDQVELIEKLARSFLGLNEGDEAHREMQLAFNLSRRVHGEDSIEHVPGMLRYAAWYRLIGEDRRARNLYQDVITMLESEHGTDHYSLIEPLTHLSAVASKPWYYLQDREAALQRADAILNKQANADAEDRAASAVRLGDFYTLVKMEEQADAQYQRAWQILSADRNPRLDEAVIFARPVVLNFPYAVVPDSRRGLRFEEHVISVTYEMDIDADGKVSNVKVLEHDGPTTLNRTLLRTAFTLRFRPRIEAGVPASTRAYRMTEKVRLETPMSRSQFMEQLRAEITRLRMLLRVRRAGA